MTRSSGGSRGWARRYPPLLSVAVAMLMAAFVLPSALNLPQTNPTQTLEYAPVPPTDDDSTPPQGNLNTLGLGSTGSIADDGLGGDLGSLLPDAPPPQAPPGTGTIPRNKRCVGNPPRQTEDLLAPPCVAYFEGNNFGATFQGVTGKEVRVLFYFNGGESDAITSQGEEKRPADACFDLAKPATDNEHVFIRALRVYQRYFNDRYQTYNRAVRFIVCYGASGTPTPESRRADAAKNYQDWKPFAVLGYPQGFQDDYLETMAHHGVLNFGSLANKPASFFTKFPGLVWSYLPSLEEQASNYADYICTEIVNKPVSFSGDAAMQGKPRKLGLISSVDPKFPDYKSYARIVKSKVEKCGGRFVAEGTFAIAQSCSGTGYTRGNNTATSSGNIATFAKNGVTTIIWPTGMEGTHSAAAGQARYYPEWVIAGDSFWDDFWSGQCQDQTVFNRHAIALTPTPLKVQTSQSDCSQSLMQTSPDFADADFICSFRTFYEDLRQLFTGIQVAGPRLTKTSVDEGFHAIPPKISRDPHVPACFYRPNDYTCVKDMAAVWWDKDRQDVNGSAPGCWRMAEGGLRHYLGTWPNQNAQLAWRPSDPCSGNAGAGLWP
jgi:hypothetical protein